MFVLDPAPTFSVLANIPVAGGGPALPLAFTGRHRRVSELRALQKRMLDESMSDTDVLLEIMADWQVQRADGSAVPFNADTVAELLDNYPGAGPALYQAYSDALREARAGN